MTTSWRDKQKTFFSEKNVEFEQDQRILDWLDYSKKTFYAGDAKYFRHRTEAVPINQAEQAVVIINGLTYINALRTSCNIVRNVPRIALAINKFLIYSLTPMECNDNYDIALLDYITELFPNRKIAHFYEPNVKGVHFNFASPTTQFFIE